MSSRIIPRTVLAATRRRVAAGPSIARRNASAAAHGGDFSKTNPVWNPTMAAASAVVFGGLGFYLLSSPPQKSEHDSHGFSSSARKDLDWEYKRLAGEGSSKSGHHADSEDKSADSGVVAASANSDSDADDKGVQDSIKSSILTDAPQQAKEGEAEGTSPPTAQKSSVQQAINNDAPKTAKKTEEDLSQKK